jgi:hypothetical protein
VAKAERQQQDRAARKAGNFALALYIHRRAGPPLVGGGSGGCGPDVRHSPHSNLEDHRATGDTMDGISTLLGRRDASRHAPYFLNISIGANSSAEYNQVRLHDPKE